MAQRNADARQVLASGFHGAAQRRGNLTKTLRRPVAEFDEPGGFWRKLFLAPSERLGQLDALFLAATFAQRQPVIVIKLHPPVLAHPAADFLAGNVAGNLANPRTKIASRFVAVQMLVSVDESLLNEVLGLLVVEEQRSDDFPYLVLVAMDDLRVGVDVAAEHAQHDAVGVGWIHGFQLSLCRSRQNQTKKKRGEAR